LNNECAQLVKDIWRIGDPEKPNVPFGQLFDDDEVQQYYEALAATLKAAKKREYFIKHLKTAVLPHLSSLLILIQYFWFISILTRRGDCHI
jgi:hypothetical protein